MNARRPVQSVCGLSVGIMAAPLDRLGQAASQIASWGGMVHFDVMDGVFVPNLTAGSEFVAAVADGNFCDVHLMVERPQAHIAAFARAGADIITVHAEASGAAEALRQVREQAALLGRPILAGLAVMPGTALAQLQPLLALAPDLVLVLALDPRDGKPADIGKACERLTALRATIKPGTILAMDGGVTVATIDQVSATAPDIIVSGSAIFKAADPGQAFRQMADVWAAGRILPAGVTHV
ncbi:MAG: ribulose phosphate epimerase [Gemmobacter sp.]|nr:ribulose phosphate epimerase [Gemmobacter sp.]